MTTYTLRGGNFGGQKMEIDDGDTVIVDGERLILLVDEHGKGWRYSLDRHEADKGFADFIGMDDA